MPVSAVATGCRSRILPPNRVIPSVEPISNWCRTNASATRTHSTTRTCPARWR